MEPQLTRRDGRHSGVSMPASAVTALHLAPFVVDLRDDAASRPGVAGAKAAALARALAAGLPVLPGFVDHDAGRTYARRRPSVALARGGVARRVAHPVRQRPAAHSSSARRRPSRTADRSRWPGCSRRCSTCAAGSASSRLSTRWSRSGGEAPIAVLVQPFLEPAWGGVLFGADPVTGRSDRLVVAAVPGGPDRLVSGEVDGVQLTLSTRGRVRGSRRRRAGAAAPGRTRRRLARLARRAADLFGGPQDIEWAIDAHGRVVMLQSRPITAVGDEAAGHRPGARPGTGRRDVRPPPAAARGGPLDPAAARRHPRVAGDHARRAGTAGCASPRSSSRSAVASPPISTCSGVTTRRRSVWSRLDPRPPARRLTAAWRVGRLRVALPALAGDLIATVDDDLRTLSPLHEFDIERPRSPARAVAPDADRAPRPRGAGRDAADRDGATIRPRRRPPCAILAERRARGR